MADDFAWSRAGATRPPACDSDAWTASMYDAGATCTQCVPGQGDRLFPGDRAVPKQSLPGGIDPLSLTFLVLSLSVLAQALTFVSFGPLGDVGAARRRGLVACSCVGSVATMLFMVLPAASGADGGLYWLGAVLTVVSNVALGTSIVFYNSYLPLLVEASPDVRAKRDEGSDDEVQGARAARESEYSQKGMGWGYAGGTTRGRGADAATRRGRHGGPGGDWPGGGLTRRGANLESRTNSRRHGLPADRRRAGARPQRLAAGPDPAGALHLRPGAVVVRLQRLVLPILHGPHRPVPSCPDPAHRRRLRLAIHGRDLPPGAAAQAGVFVPGSLVLLLGCAGCPPPRPAGRREGTDAPVAGQTGSVRSRRWRPSSHGPRCTFPLPSRWTG